MTGVIVTGPTSFSRCSEFQLEQAWQDWIEFEREFQRGNSAEVRKYPDHATPRARRQRAVGSVSRGRTTTSQAGHRTLAFRYPGVVEYVGALNTRDGSRRRLADIKRAMHYRVASFAFDPSSGTAFYTNDNLALRDLMSVDVKTGEARMLLEDARIGEIVFNPSDRSLWGVRHNNGIATLVRVPHPYVNWVEVHTFPYEHVPTD